MHPEFSILKSKNILFQQYVSHKPGHLSVGTSVSRSDVNFQSCVNTSTVVVTCVGLTVVGSTSKSTHIGRAWPLTR